MSTDNVHKPFPFDVGDRVAAWVRTTTVPTKVVGVVTQFQADGMRTVIHLDEPFDTGFTMLDDVAVPTRHVHREFPA